MKPPELKFGDPSVKDVDASVKNKFRWAWFNDEVDLDLGPKYQKMKLKVGDTLFKTPEAGVCWCKLCCRNVVYSSSGKKALNQHIKTPHHARKWKHLLDTKPLFFETFHKDAVPVGSVDDDLNSTDQSQNDSLAKAEVSFILCRA